jgi:hypothetical protein
MKLNELGLVAGHYRLRPCRFELRHLGQPTAMPVRTAELCAEKISRALPRNRDTGGSASKAKYILVLVFHSLPGRKMIMTKRGADTHSCTPMRRNLALGSGRGV